MPDEDGRTYTVAELIAALQTLDPAAKVGVYSGCHDCGGELVEIATGPSDRDGNPWVSLAGTEDRSAY